MLNIKPNKNKEVTQFFYVTNDNEYMLLYPNYQNDVQKREVILQIARNHQYERKFDEEYVYADDYELRRRDYRNNVYKKISHLCNEEYRNENQIKRADHLRTVLNYDRKLNTHDRIVLSTDQERSMVFVYQQQGSSGQNKIELYEYKNNIAWAAKAKHLPEQITEIQEEQDAEFGRPEYTKKLCPPNNSFYVNGNFRHVVSNEFNIKTTIEDSHDASLKATHRIAFKDMDQFMVVEDPNGFYLNMRIKHEFNYQNVPYVIRVEMYNKNEFFYTFFFSLTNDIDKFDHKHTYFAVRLSIDEVLEKGADNHLPIVDNETECVVFRENDLKAEDDSILRNYTQIMNFTDLVDMQKAP